MKFYTLKVQSFVLRSLI
jgi:NAD(P)-dependent dehydrogenase (short-subunit alcohol dehydrogenase family)